MKALSLRHRLTASYAGIALLTVLLLGLVLILLLPPFFARVERDYLKNAASLVAFEIRQEGGVGPKNVANLSPAVSRLALQHQVRIRVFDKSGQVLADSGTPADASAVNDQSRTDQVLARDGRVVGRIEVSSGPRVGTGLVAGIAWAWAIAGGLAVLVSALVGSLLARATSAPISELTRVSGAMARGDLSARAEVAGSSEVRQLALTFNEMADGMQDTVESLGRFVGDAAHEIGTPLTALQADLELAQDAPFDEGVPNLLERALSHAERIRKLTRDLLALSRLEAAATQHTSQRVDLGVLVEEVVESFASRSEQAGVELEFERGPAQVEVVGDKASLSRAVGNLLDNAVKFTPNGGHIDVRLDVDGGDAVLDISNTGSRISAEDLVHVFERFHRGRGAVGIPGSGLGLAIVKATIDAHQGTVSIASDAVATTVHVRVPLGLPGAVSKS